MDILETLQGELAGVVEERKWKKKLPGDLREYFQSVSEIVRSLGDLVAEYSDLPISVESLEAVREVWVRAELLGIPIKEVEFKIHGLGYDMYSGTTFRTLADLNERLTEPLVGDHIVRDSHKLVIRMK